jgi:hypothetical protein
LFLNFLEKLVDAHLLSQEANEVVDVDALLLHAVAVAECHGVILECLVVDGDTVRCTDSVLATIAFTDRVFLVVLASEVITEGMLYLSCFLGEAIFLDEGQHGAFYRREGCGEVEHYAAVTVLQFLVLIAGAKHAKEHTVNTDRGLDHVRHVALVKLGIEVLNLLA